MGNIEFCSGEIYIRLSAVATFNDYGFLGSIIALWEEDNESDFLRT